MNWRAIKPSDTRYTSFYADLWHRDFVLLLLSEALLTIAIVITLFSFGDLMTASLNADEGVAKYPLISFGAGFCIIGLFVSMLTERYRRNKVFVISTFLLAGAVALTFFFDELRLPQTVLNESSIYCLSFLCGAFYGISMRLMIGVLIIDKCESYNRTEANYVSMWTAYISVVVALIFLGIANKYLSVSIIYTTAYAMILCAAIIVAFLTFPFRTPVEEVRLFSTDRFIFFQGIGYSFLLLFSTFFTARMLCSHNEMMFCAMLLFGLVVVILTHCVFNDDTTARREMLVGMLLLCFSWLTNIFYDTGEIFVIITSMLISMSFGYISIAVMRQLLITSNHCQRSTVICSHLMTVVLGSIIASLM